MNDPLEPGSSDALSMTHEPESPNPAAPYLAAARELNPFGGRGVSQILKQQGVQMPAWSNRIGNVLQSEAANTAIGMATPLKGAFKVLDAEHMLRIEPQGMQIPEWGKGLKWGLTAYRTNDRNGRALTIRDVRLPPEMQRQGLGTAMYKHAADVAAKEGLPLHSDSTVTEAAVNSWMNLHRSGHEVILSPKAIYRPGPPEAPELGRLETEDGSPVFRIMQETKK